MNKLGFIIYTQCLILKMSVYFLNLFKQLYLMQF
jgi:hypothetical protein